MAALAVVAGAGHLLGACPPKEVRIDLTDAGIDYVVRACGLPCTEDCCTIDGGELPTASDQIYVELLLATADNQVDFANARIRSQSPCMQLRLGCDFTEAAGTSGQLAACLAVQLDDLIAESMPAGLGFDGLDDPDDVMVALAFFSSAAGGCTSAALFACAGLTERYEDTYDVTCASCAGGARQHDPASSQSVAPCVGECFVESCQKLLAASER